MDSEQEFIPLKYNDKYEISTTEPWNFRRIGKTECLKQEKSNSGYMRVSIGHSNKESVHRLVALQYIENNDPDNNKVVHHKDDNKLNNSINNLEWTTNSNNLKLAKRGKRQSNEYLDILPSNVYEITSYTEHDLDGYYFDIDEERILKVLNNGRIKIIRPTIHGERLLINFNSVDKKPFQRSYVKLIKSLREIINQEP